MAVERGRILLSAGQKLTVHFDYTEVLFDGEGNDNGLRLDGNPDVEAIQVEGSETLTVGDVAIESIPVKGKNESQQSFDTRLASWKGKPSKVSCTITANASVDSETEQTIRNDQALDSKWRLTCRVRVDPGGFVRPATLYVVGGA